MCFFSRFLFFLCNYFFMEENMRRSKREYICILREQSENIFSDLSKSKLSLPKKASEMNKQLNNFRKSEVSKIIKYAKVDNWSTEILLNELLLLTYSSYIVMLESRNDIWLYDYMTFSRRIGELWEPFCKLPFTYSIKKLNLITPPAFSCIQNSMQSDMNNFIDNLNLDIKIKYELKQKYEIPWTMVDSGGINLKLDLHFEQNGNHYNCDFKSGFNSNEKGNTNRLLLVGSIFKYIGENENQIIFVRQKENENNHYLQTLKKSKYWNVYCADECYEVIKKYTDFDLRNWLTTNADWKNDISEGFRKHLEENNLLKYLTW